MRGVRARARLMRTIANEDIIKKQALDYFVSDRASMRAEATIAAAIPAAFRDDVFSRAAHSSDPLFLSLALRETISQLLEHLIALHRVLILQKDSR